jgi:hypothetical protein
MKNIYVLTAALALATFTMSSFALDQSVNVGATLTSVCKAQTPGAVALSFVYPAFSAAPVPATPVNVTFECTRGFGQAPVVSFNGGSGVGVVAGLQYTMAATNTGGSVGAAATTTSIGAPTTYIYTITGTMPDGQAGDAAASATDARTMTITY